MTIHECPDCGHPIHFLDWGPFRLVAPWPIDPDKLDAQDFDEWVTVGLSLDPLMLGNDFTRVLRQVRAFMGYVRSVTGCLWEEDADALAMRVFQSDGPVILPLWDRVDAHKEKGEVAGEQNEAKETG